MGGTVAIYGDQWQVSDDGSTGWADVSGETAAGYAFVSGDLGKYFRTTVDATNTGDTATAVPSSNVLGPVVAADIATDVSWSIFGSQSLLSVGGAQSDAIAVTEGEPYVLSLWGKFTSGRNYALRIIRADTTTVVSELGFIGTGQKQRVWTAVGSYPATEDCYCVVETTDDTADNFNVDGAQMENKAIPTPFAGDGASRTAATISVDSSLLDVVQGGAVIRAKIGFDPSDTSGLRTFLCALLSGGDGYDLTWQEGSPRWKMARSISSSSEDVSVAAANFSAVGDEVTLACGWVQAGGATRLYLSVNGSTWATYDDSRGDISGALTINLGSAASDQQCDSALKYAVLFKGDPAVLDVAAVHTIFEGGGHPYLSNFSTDLEVSAMIPMIDATVWVPR